MPPGRGLMDRAEARIANRIEDLPVVVELLDRFGEDNDIPVATIDDVNVALDEALSNIIAYAYEADSRRDRRQAGLLPGRGAGRGGGRRQGIRPARRCRLPT